MDYNQVFEKEAIEKAEKFSEIGLKTLFKKYPHNGESIEELISDVLTDHVEYTKEDMEQKFPDLLEGMDEFDDKYEFLKVQAVRRGAIECSNGNFIVTLGFKP